MYLQDYEHEYNDVICSGESVNDNTYKLYIRL